MIMCGIYGTTLRYDSSIIDEKMKRTGFRGPDFTGVKKYNLGEEILTLGHNRLSIIDLEARSNQPFDYENRCSIVFNGEIYNFRELKKELTQKNYSFQTTSDTEVLCAAYMEWGARCLQKLNGMFSFVIFDKQKQELFGARDRMGQKPFYYCNTEGGFEFSSQLSSIQLGRKDLTISKDSIGRYLAWGNIPDPDSIFNEIKKLKAGHYLSYTLKERKLTIEPYWDISTETANTYQGSYQEAVQELDILLTDAVEKRLFADVPMGVFLSGGIDSSLIASLASKSSPGKIQTFSIKFNEQGFDESKYAEAVAQHLGTKHKTIACSVNEGLDLIQNITHYYDEPFADSSAIPSMLLAKHTRKHVTVALTGDGGDESFLGYARYKWLMNAQKAFAFPKFFRKPVAALLKKMPQYRLKLIGEGLKEENIEDFYLYVMSGLDNSWLDVRDGFKDVEEMKYLRGNLPFQQRMGDFDLKSYLNWDINTKVDRATMAFSLEARAPLLDYRVVELARSLPVDFKFKGANQKRILKDVLYNYAPQELFDRPKAGFTMPFKEWFKKDLKEYVLDMLSEEQLRDIPCIYPAMAKNMITQHMEGSWNRSSEIWKLLVLQQWLEKNASGYAVK